MSEPGIGTVYPQRSEPDPLPLSADDFQDEAPRHPRRFDENRYYQGSEYTNLTGRSFFRDLLLISDAEQRLARQLEDPQLSAALRGRDQGPSEPPSFVENQTGGAKAARARISSMYETADRQYRNSLKKGGIRADLSSTSTAGGEFLPATGTPVHIARAFATAARIRGVLPRVLAAGELPDKGLQVETPRDRKAHV